MRTRIKICGITRPEDGVAAAELGVDAIGLVFYPPSPRAVSPAQARAVVDALPCFVTVVGLFLDPQPEWVRQVLAEVPLDCLQFHGSETQDACLAYGRPFIKALPMGEAGPVRHADYARASALLLDSHRAGQAGGTGQVFDWAGVPRDLGRPIILAGGLTPDNVTDAVRQVQPYGVDVSGGVESAKGIKDARRMAAFVQAVNSVTSAAHGAPRRNSD